jgi:hypothetical protein
VPYFRSPGQKAAPVEASEEVLQILQESKAIHYDGIAMGQESWF